MTLEYKRAAALAKSNDKISEATKDVSAFANASGGTLIYGIAEAQNKIRRHLPERLDPVVRTDFSKGWLEQVVQNIQPRIDGVVIPVKPIAETRRDQERSADQGDQATEADRAFG